MMIDTKPWMGVRDLGAVLRHPINSDDAKLAGPWALEGDKPFWLSRSSWGMSALAKALASKSDRQIRVWLPEYFCDQALWPLRQQQTELHFYPVDERAHPDWARIDRKAPAPDIFFLTHFFGHASDHIEARKFCDETGALLVEDATQALGPDAIIGHEGDVVFYSPWKFFPVPNGALMLIRPRAARWIAPVEQAVAALGERISPGLQWLKQSALANGPGPLRRGQLSGCGDGDFFRDPDTVPMPTRPRPSPVSKPVLATVNLQETGRRRRENDAAVREFFRDISGWEPFDAPSSGPMRSVFRLDTEARADAAHIALRKVGIEAGGWPALPPEVADSQSHAVRLRRTVMTVPCHQDLRRQTLLEVLHRSGLKSGR